MAQPLHREPLTLAERFSLVYLLLPIALFLLGWFNWYLSLPLVVLLIAAIAPALRGELRDPFNVAIGWIALSALAWVLLTGAGGILDTNTNADWIKNDAILLDMVRGGWPTYLPTEGLRQEPLLRYYLGYYLVPAGVGQLLGVSALDWAVPLWTWTGVTLLMTLFAGQYRGRALLIAIAVLVFFSGMDIVRVLLFEDLDAVEFGSSHIEWDYFGGMRVQYSSHMVGLMYVPQHFLAAGLYTMLLIRLGQHAGFLRLSGPLLAASLFWSPFVALGLLPLVLVLLWKNGLKPFLSWPNLVLALPLALLLLVYLLGGSANFPQGWLVNKHGWQLVSWLPVFFINQFLLLAALLCWLQPELRREPFFLVALASLLLLPWYQYGYFNDLAMRASLPALFLLSFYCAHCLADNWPERQKAMPRGPLAALVIVLCAGAVTPLFEISRVLNFDDGERRRYEQLDYTTLSTVHRFFRGQYTARNIPDWYRGLMKNGKDRDDDG